MNNGAFGATKVEHVEGVTNAIDSAKNVMDSGWANIKSFAGAVKSKADSTGIP